MTTKPKECDKDAAIEQLNNNIKAVQEAHETKVKYLAEIRSSSSKLKLEEDKTIQEINTLIGSYNAYQESLKIINNNKTN